jgi:integrase
VNKIIRREKYGQRGEGSLILREGCGNWLYQYFHAGKLHEESTGCAEAEFKAARRFVKDKRQKIGAHHQGLKKYLPASQQKVTVGELLDALIVDLRVRQCKSLAQIESHMKPIRERFGLMKAVDVTGRLVDSYIAQRQAAGAPNASINRGTQLLSQCYRREMKQDQPRVISMPTIKRLPEKNARQGFFEAEDFMAVVAGLPPVLQDFLQFAYLTAWRPGDLKALRWDHIEGDTIRLPDSKNGKPKSLAVVGDLVGIIRRREQARLLETKDGNVRLAEYVFHRDGHPIVDYRRAWLTACRATGFTYKRIDPRTGKAKERVSKLVYDCKRTGIRNLTRQFGDKVAMDIAGIKTRAILDRYNISSDREKRAALEAVRLPVGNFGKT